MEAAILVVIMIAGFTYSAIKTKESWKNRCKRTLKEKYGKEPEKKEFKRELIRNYLDTVDGTQQVDEVTWNDLNMDDVYQRSNNCDSTMEEEILYPKLHYAKQTKEEEELLEKRIAFCEADDEKRYQNFVKAWKERRGLLYSILYPDSRGFCNFKSLGLSDAPDIAGGSCCGGSRIS